MPKKNESEHDLASVLNFMGNNLQIVDPSDMPHGSFVLVPVAFLASKTASYNPRRDLTPVDQEFQQLQASLGEFGVVENVVWNRRTKNIVGGHQRVKTAVAAGITHLPTCVVDIGLNKERLLNIALNKIQGGWDTEKLIALLADLQEQDLAAENLDIGLSGFSDAEIESMVKDVDLSMVNAMRNFDADENQHTDGQDGSSVSMPEMARTTLVERFVVPPFSVFDTRQGYWQNRKRAWLGLGIKSEEGRGENLTPPRKAAEMQAATKKDQRLTLYMPEWADRGPSVGDQQSGARSGTSIFDPVLCEILDRWFCPQGGHILDPFAGGSVRGIVAAALGRKYTGIDLRAEQVEANEKQWSEIEPRLSTLHFSGVGPQAAEIPDNMPDLTPVELRGDIWFKRDDLFSVAGVCGGKVRTCWRLAQGAKGLTAAGPRDSSQVNIVSHIAARLGIPCRVHTPEGKLSAEVENAKRAGAEVIQHKAGYSSVISARARADAEERGWRYIPYMMECQETIKQTRVQVANIPKEINRLVVPVGSGMSLAGILWGMKDYGIDVPVIGVRVGADPIKRLDEYAPRDWRENVTIVESAEGYHSEATNTEIGGIRLDPGYEAKCIPFLKPGDLLWVVGIKQSVLQSAQAERNSACDTMPRWIVGDACNIRSICPGEYDFVMTCPPYADLEVYSDSPADLSNMDYDTFMISMRKVIKDACAMLKQDRFAAIVVGEVRSKKDGIYRGFVPDIIQAFAEAGLSYYNEAILVTAVGSLPVRVGRQFSAGRKLGKTHQNILVFVKGDPSAATAAVGECEAGDTDVFEISEMGPMVPQQSDEMTEDGDIKYVED